MYDIHVATEGGSAEAVRVGLSTLGFKDDNLSKQGLTFNSKTAQYYSSCPLIDIHVSRKISVRQELLIIQKQVINLMEKYGAIGYIHSEWTREDKTIDNRSEAVVGIKPLPFRTLYAEPRDTQKKWDLHVSVKESELTDNLKSVLLDGGLYYLSRWKGSKGSLEEYAVFTVQGINRVSEGKKLFDQLITWLGDTCACEYSIKLEVTTFMRTFNSPSLIPPTINEIIWT